MKREAAPAAALPAAGAAFSSKVLAQSLRRLIGPLAGARFCVAYSGGMDSTALLAACAQLRGRYRCRLRAIHVNHRLQPSAVSMAAASRAAARRLGVPCLIVNAPVIPARGDSIEAAARETRYAALRAALREGEWLLLAQHQDDQVESVLLQLLRGAGVAGLAAMASRNGPVVRPLLDVTREQLLRYLRARSIRWIEDPSNADERFARNYLRHRVLPLLRERWPGLGAAIGRSATLAAEAQQLLTERAAAQLQNAHDGAALSVSALRRLPEPDRRNALRHWLELRGLSRPDQRRLREISGPMLQARSDAQPAVQWSAGAVRRHGGLLYALPRLVPSAHGFADPSPRSLLWDWRRKPRLALPDGAWLELRDDPRGPWLRSALPARLRVGFRGADGKVGATPGGRRLKRVLQQSAVPPWSRSSVPVLFAGRRLLAIGDQWCATERPAPRASRRAQRCRLHLYHESAALI